MCSINHFDKKPILRFLNALPNYLPGKLYQYTASPTIHEATHLTIFCRTDHNFWNVYLFDRWELFIWGKNKLLETSISAFHL